ncbi:MAG TPA: cobalamin biosynthesis protein CobD [Dehalococcoidia bacterium]|jgi:adenosylcobinamide-phosphate synthase|nr:cobalamin biosynthesis protein CobD [Dehalococcoidia bacterium]
MVLALLWDVIWGEPRRFHPVSWIGGSVSLLEKKAPRQGKVMPFLYGLGMTILVPGIFAAAVYFLGRGLQRLSDVAYIAVGAYLLKGCFALRELDRAALRVSGELEANRLGGAREQLKSLVSRETAGLSPELVASAAVESVAENTTDSFLAPWLAFALLGLPGAIAYRALNTLDSMIGYHGKHEHLGKAAARLDDLINLIPARLAALFISMAALLQGLSAKRAWLTMRRQHNRTESPNAGWTMSAMAGALGVQLQKVGHYQLGEPLNPLGPAQIKQATVAMRWVAGFSFLLALGILVARYVVFQ